MPKVADAIKALSEEVAALREEVCQLRLSQSFGQRIVYVPQPYPVYPTYPVYPSYPYQPWPTYIRYGSLADQHPTFVGFMAGNAQTQLTAGS